jgi:HD-like signal output (HDOD) protein
MSASAFSNASNPSSPASPASPASPPSAPPPSLPYFDEAFDSAALELEAERIARELKLPPCPKILDDFYREMNEEDADVRRLGDCVGADLALTAALLKTVNSPAYGLSRTTSNVQQAITIIGLRATTSLISRLLFRQAFPETQGFLMREFWESTARLTEAGHHVSRVS